MNMPSVLRSEVDGVHVVAFPRDPQGQANLDQVRHYFSTAFLDETRDHRRLVIDLAGVPTLDSSCLGPLVQKLRWMQDQGGRLALCGVESPALKEIFALTRFDKVFPIFALRDEAVGAVRASG